MQAEAKERAWHTVRQLIETYMMLDEREINLKTDEIVNMCFEEQHRLIPFDIMFNFCDVDSFPSLDVMSKFAGKLSIALNKNNFINKIYVRTFAGQRPTEKSILMQLNIKIENKLYRKRVTRSRYENDDENSGTDTDREPDPDSLNTKADIEMMLRGLHARLSLLENSAAQNAANVGLASRFR
jgi:hypothetical protein